MWAFAARCLLAIPHCERCWWGWTSPCPACSPAKHLPIFRAMAVSRGLGNARTTVRKCFFPPKTEAILFSSPFYKPSNATGENASHRQSDMTMATSSIGVRDMRKGSDIKPTFSSWGDTVPAQVSLTQHLQQTAQLLPSCCK